MITEDQSEVVAFLSDPSTHGGCAVERIETHASIVFLAGAQAWKMKRAVRYDYLDFSTAARRREMCEGELRLNRPTAPALYLAVVPITREADGSLAIGGQGTAVEWLVSMRRFDQGVLLDRLAAAGALDPGLMAPLGRAIARFHMNALPRQDRGGAERMAWVIDGNARGLREFAADIIPDQRIAVLAADARARLAIDETRLEARRGQGLVRACHGDLHLRNVVLLDGVPTLFDGIEFNEDLSCVDVAYDLAFLLMDLWRRDLPSHANAVWNAWLDLTADLGAIPLLPLFLSCRAAIRAKTSAMAAALKSDEGQRVELQALTDGYLGLAQRLLVPPPPRLVAIGGLSGSGKSTLARLLAPHVGAVPGAVVTRSDVLRKGLFGLEPLEPLGPDAYTPEVSRRVYASAIDRASLVVSAGHGAIVDAVFTRTADREAIARAAAAARVPFVGLWLEAPERVRLARAAGRRADASDAGADVVRWQRGETAGLVTWHRLDSTRTPSELLADAVKIIGTPARTTPA